MFFKLLTNDFAQVVVEACWGFSRLIANNKTVSIQSQTQLQIEEWCQSESLPQTLLTLLTRLPSPVAPLCVFFQEWMMNDDANIITMRNLGGLHVLNYIKNRDADGEWTFKPLSVVNHFLVRQIINNWTREHSVFTPVVLRVMILDFVGFCIVNAFMV